MDHHLRYGLEKIGIEIDHGLDIQHPAHINAVFDVPDIEVRGDVATCVHLIVAKFERHPVEFSWIVAVVEQALLGRNIFGFDVNVLRDGKSFDKISYSRVGNTL